MKGFMLFTYFNNQEIGLLGYRTTKTPIEPNLKFEVAKVEEIKDKDRYQGACR